MDDEIDVDGEEDAAYGIPQFTEIDVLNPLICNCDQDEEVDTEDFLPSNSVRGGIAANNSGDLDAARKMEKKDLDIKEVKQSIHEDVSMAEMEELDKAIARARKSGTTRALVEALESKLAVLVSSTEWRL